MGDLQMYAASTYAFMCCPRCNGQGHTMRPPWVAGDMDTWMSTTTSSWPCPPCNGSGLLVVQ